MISFSERTGGGLRIDLCDAIFNYDAPIFRAAMAQFEDDADIEVHLASPGGDVDGAFIMLNALSERKDHVTIHTEGTVASAATLLLCADGVKVVAHKGSVFMVHMTSTALYGNAEELQKAREMLSKYDDEIVHILSSRMTVDEAKVRELLESETWLSAQEAKDLGLVDEIADDPDEEEPEEPKEEDKPKEDKETFSLDGIQSQVVDLFMKVTGPLTSSLSELTAQTKHVAEDSAHAVEAKAAVKIADIEKVSAKVNADLKAYEDRLAVRALEIEQRMEELREAHAESIHTIQKVGTSVVDAISEKLQLCLEAVSRAYALEGLEVRGKSAQPFTLNYTK